MRQQHQQAASDSQMQGITFADEGTEDKREEVENVVVEDEEGEVNLHESDLDFPSYEGEDDVF